MRIKAIQVGSQWVVTPEDGTFKGIRIGKADGLSLKAVDFDGLAVTGEVCSVWGLEVEESAIFNDPRTVKGLRIGQPFDMRRLHPLMEHEGRFVLSETGTEVTGAASLWVLGQEMQSFGESMRSQRSRPVFSA